MGNETWKKLENKDWSNLYATSWVPGFSDIHLIVDRVAFDVHVLQNWSYTLEVPNGTICGRPVSWLHNESLDITFSLWSTASTLDHDQRFDPRSRFMVNITDYWNNIKTFPDLQWPSSYAVHENTSQTLANYFEVCLEDGWLLPTTAFHVQDAQAKVNPYANRVQVAIPFLSVVILSNIVKIASIWFTIRMQSSDYIFITGDAVATFFERPEPATEGKCTLTRPQLCDPRTKVKMRPWRIDRKVLIVVLGGARVWSAMTM